MASDDLSSDVTMATLAGGIQALQAEFAAMRTRENSIRTELAALRSQDGIQNLSLDERGRERPYRPFQGAPRPHNTKDTEPFLRRARQLGAALSALSTGAPRPHNTKVQYFFEPPGGNEMHRTS